MIRITGGKLKGRNVNSIKKEELRPTTSFFREWVFNVLNNIINIDEIKLLDLFSGTGIVSFEFISRGASSSVAVEKDKQLTSLIKTNAFSLALNNVDVVSMDCVEFLKRTFSKEIKLDYNVCFMDAPYEKSELIDEALSIISSNYRLLPDDVLIIVETEKDKELNISDNFVILKTKSSGTTKMTVIGRKD